MPGNVYSIVTLWPSLAWLYLFLVLQYWKEITTFDTATTYVTKHVYLLISHHWRTSNDTRFFASCMGIRPTVNSLTQHLLPKKTKVTQGATWGQVSFVNVVCFQSCDIYLVPGRGNPKHGTCLVLHHLHQWWGRIPGRVHTGADYSHLALQCGC